MMRMQSNKKMSEAKELVFNKCHRMRAFTFRDMSETATVKRSINVRRCRKEP